MSRAKLVRLYKIATSYLDSQGKKVTVPEETIEKILEVSRAGSVVSEKLKRVHRALAPVILCPEGEFKGKIVVTLPRAAFDTLSRIPWKIQLESGDILQGDSSKWSLIRELTVAREKFVRVKLELYPLKFEFGYHSLFIFGDKSLLISYPKRCYQSDILSARKHWGVAVQLYNLFQRGDTGIGDLSHLKTVVETVKGAGGSFVGVSPIHALTFSRPREFSPYSPISRIWFNPYFVDLEVVSKAQGSTINLPGPSEWARTINYGEVSRLKREALRALFDEFCDQNIELDGLLPKSAIGKSFVDFSDSESLRRYARFEELNEKHGGIHWLDWPPEHLECDVSAHGSLTKDALFYVFIQWALFRQLQSLENIFGEDSIGLYLDLAVGAGSAGADSWVYKDIFVKGVSVGCPPDAYNTLGQDWGFEPLSPSALWDSGFEVFREVLNANMRFAGALRIDHAMSLLRLFWIPEGEKPTVGTYVRYPVEAMCAVLSLESHRNKCMVVGEDLGTVPDEFKSIMERFGIYSYKVFAFMRDLSGGLLPREAYPPESLVTTTTHDMPSLWGCWEETDLVVKDKLGLYLKPEQKSELWQDRQSFKNHLAQYLETSFEKNSLEEADLAKVFQFLSQVGSRLMVVPYEDLIGEKEQINLPGVVEGYPSWQIRSENCVGDLANNPLFKALSRVFFS